MNTTAIKSYEILKECDHDTEEASIVVDAAKRLAKAEAQKGSAAANMALGVFYKNQLEYWGTRNPNIADDLYEVAVQHLQRGAITADDKYELAMAHKYYATYLFDIERMEEYDALYNKANQMLIDCAYSGSMHALATLINCNGDALYDVVMTNAQFQELCSYCYYNAAGTKEIYEFVRIMNTLPQRRYLADIRAMMTLEKYNPQNPKLQSFMINCRRSINICGICYKYLQLYNYCCGGAEHNYCFDCIATIQRNPTTARCPECRECCHPRYNGAFINNANVTVRRLPPAPTTPVPSLYQRPPLYDATAVSAAEEEEAEEEEAIFNIFDNEPVEEEKEEEVVVVESILNLFNNNNEDEDEDEDED